MPTDDEILSYLAQHPSAQDTLEGIVEWWLLEQRIERTTADVKAGLDKLVAQNLVVARQGGDGRIRYRANFAKTDVEKKKGRDR